MKKAIADEVIAEITRVVRDEGFAFLPRFATAASTLEVANAVGSPLAFGSNGPVHQISPKPTSEASDNSYSGIYGLGNFPMHTDMAHWNVPPRYMLLRCVRGSAEVATLLRRASDIVDQIGKEKLSNTLVRPRRPVRGKIQVLRLLDSVDSARNFFRWDRLFLKPLTSSSEAVFNLLMETIDETSDASVSLSNPCDTLIFDNWLMLHARSAARNMHGARVIERVYLGGLN